MDIFWWTSIFLVFLLFQFTLIYVLMPSKILVSLYFKFSGIRRSSEDNFIVFTHSCFDRLSLLTNLSSPRYVPFWDFLQPLFNWYWTKSKLKRRSASTFQISTFISRKTLSVYIYISNGWHSFIKIAIYTY